MIKIQLGELVNSKITLDKIANTSLSAKNSYRILKLLKLINSELEEFENVRISLIKKFGVKNEDDDAYQILDEDNKNKFMNEMRELLSNEIEINYNRVDLSSSTDKLEISAVEMNLVNKLIDFGFDE